VHPLNTASSFVRTNIVMMLYYGINVVAVASAVVNQVLVGGWTWITTIAVCVYAACFASAVIGLWRLGLMKNG